MTSAAIGRDSYISTDDPLLRYMGRVARSADGGIAFDWPGITIEAAFTGSRCSAVMKGENRFDAFVDGTLAKTFRTGAGKTTISLVQGLDDGVHRLLIVKRSESTRSPTLFFGLLLDSGKTLVPLPAPPDRRIEFIGDSYTAGFACEYHSRECREGTGDSIVFETTNTHLAFGPLAARAFGAQYHVIAISGKGLVRNYNGTDKGLELPKFYPRTLLSGNDKGNEWDFSSWKADVGVIGLGINDFQAEPPYADSTEFDTAYEALIARLRTHYPGIKIICCATRVWPTDALIPRVKSIVAARKKAGNGDVFYFEYSTGNSALYGHPGIADHAAIADSLAVLMAKITGWTRKQ